MHCEKLKLIIKCLTVAVSIITDVVLSIFGKPQPIRKKDN